MALSFQPRPILVCLVAAVALFGSGCFAQIPKTPVVTDGVAQKVQDSAKVGANNAASGVLTNSNKCLPIYAVVKGVTVQVPIVGGVLAGVVDTVLCILEAVVNILFGGSGIVVTLTTVAPKAGAANTDALPEGITQKLTILRSVGGIVTSALGSVTCDGTGAVAGKMPTIGNPLAAVTALLGIVGQINALPGLGGVLSIVDLVGCVGRLNLLGGGLPLGGGGIVSTATSLVGGLTGGLFGGALGGVAPGGQ